jgi:hypothetical protein
MCPLCQRTIKTMTKPRPIACNLGNKKRANTNAQEPQNQKRCGPEVRWSRKDPERRSVGPVQIDATFCWLANFLLIL